MKAYVITLENNENSQRTANRLKESAPIDVETFWGITPNAVDSIMIKDGLKWTYPWNKPVDDFASGLTLHPYMTAEPKKELHVFYLIIHYGKCVMNLMSRFLYLNTMHFLLINLYQLKI